MTVSQLLMTQILKSHDELTKEGSIPLYDPFLSEKITTFEQILTGEECSSFKNITKVNTIQVSEKGLKIHSELRQLVDSGSVTVDGDEQIFNKIRAIFNKNNCKDIFKNTKIDGEHIYEPV
jgi:hypothetical protein